ncbi:MAG: Phage tail fiber [uncultured Gemmatimonadetes bacterium]|uniref:Phage tail fiber n=1 Tax=uncultured Gemmatimonadota bacterium TaxID=203437 RepID=A0A6J4MQZ2_9BACT|nr:MAG: Phage tail fiber [uncultured Gemmatimonadota bacterium]
MPGPVPLSQTDFGNLKGVNVADGVLATDVAAFGQVGAARSAAITTANAYTDSQLAGLQSGQTPKGAVRAAVGTNVTIASPGAALDGVTAVNGDVFLLAGQTSGAQNGPYVFNGASSAMTRAANWDAQAEAVLGSYWIVREGTNADTFALLTNDAFTLGTTTATFKYVGITQASQTLGYSGTSPVVAAGGTWTITHNLGTDKIIVQFRRVSTGRYVTCEVGGATSTQVQAYPDVALAAGEIEALVGRVA